jgi:hypothetical protein
MKQVAEIVAELEALGCTAEDFRYLVEDYMLNEASLLIESGLKEVVECLVVDSNMTEEELLEEAKEARESL